MSQNQLDVIQQMHNHVVAKAVHDAAFRAALIANPRAAVEKELNLTLPANFKLNVVESPTHTLTVVLPHVSAVAADGELGDEDLEAVAGGAGKIGGPVAGGPIGWPRPGIEPMPPLGSVIGIVGGPIPGLSCGSKHPMSFTK